MARDPITLFSYENLVRCTTDNFSEDNYIGCFQFGRLYHGKIIRIGAIDHVVVKIWETPEISNYGSGENELRLMEEIVLLRHEKIICHPCMIKLHGFCNDGKHLGAVFKFKAFHSVLNLIPKDSFTWLKRIKVAVELASLLKFLHGVGNSLGDPFIIRNLDAAHILLDEACMPRLCDFGVATSGILPDRMICQEVLRSYGCIDVSDTNKGNGSVKQDVFAFGILLLGLITKKAYTGDDNRAQASFVYEWARKEYYSADEPGSTMKKPDRSLVHHSLVLDPDFYSDDGVEITAIAMGCLNSCEHERPTMRQVFKSLLKLLVIKQHEDVLVVNKLQHSI